MTTTTATTKQFIYTQPFFFFIYCWCSGEWVDLRKHFLNLKFQFHPHYNLYWKIYNTLFYTFSSFVLRHNKQFFSLSLRLLFLILHHDCLLEEGALAFGSFYLILLKFSFFFFLHILYFYVRLLLFIDLFRLIGSLTRLWAHSNCESWPLAGWLNSTGPITRQKNIQPFRSMFIFEGFEALLGYI